MLAEPLATTKIILVAKSITNTLWLTLAINLVLVSGTRLQKRHQLLIALSRNLKYFDAVELVCPLDKFQVF